MASDHSYLPQPVWQAGEQVAQPLAPSGSTAKTPFEKVFKAVIPFYVPLIICLLLITYFPGRVMFLPNLLLPLR